MKLCIDDGSGGSCSGPRGNTQLHSVGAYERYSGAKTLETMEGEFTAAMGGMKQYVIVLYVVAWPETGGSGNDIASAVSVSGRAPTIPKLLSSFSDRSLSRYDPFMELHVMFMTKDLDSYGESGLSC